MTPEEIAASVARAYSRLNAKPNFRHRCEGCGHEAEVTDDPEKSIYRCGECCARSAFGIAMPRIVNLPHVDRRFVVSKFEKGAGQKKVEVLFTLDREFGAQYALDLLSVCEPELFKKVLAALAPGSPPPPPPEARPAVDPAKDFPAPPSPEVPLQHPVHERKAPAAEPVYCQCGEPAELANGACRACAFGTLA